MRLNRSGANADRRFIGFRTPLNVRNYIRSWRSPSASNRRARSGRALFRPPPQISTTAGSPCPSRKASRSGKLLNLHRMKDFRRGAVSSIPEGRTALPKQAFDFHTSGRFAADRWQSPRPPISIRNTKSCNPRQLGTSSNSRSEPFFRRYDGAFNQLT
jgi:hypothetical protein